MSIESEINALIDAKLAPVQDAVNVNVQHLGLLDADMVSLAARVAALESAAPPKSVIGPRYDLYGAGASGDFPTFPTIGGSTVLLPAATAAAGWSAVESFINSQSSGTTIVFDSSGGGTDYGAGTEIVIDNRIRINNGYSVLKTGVTLWGYNTRIRQTTMTRQSGTRSSDLLWFDGGGFEDWSILGFDLMGPNTNAGTYDCRTADLADEEGPGINIVAFNGVDILDCYFHDLYGDAIYVPGWDSFASRHYGSWSHGSHPRDMEVGWCHVDGTARQTLAIQQGSTIRVHHTRLEHSGLATWNNEDQVYGTQRYLRDVRIENCEFATWSCGIKDVPNGSLHNWPLMFVSRTSEIDVVDDVTIDSCSFDVGHLGWGNPDAEVEVYGSVQNGGAGNGGVHVMASPAPWYGLSDCRYSTNLTFTNNTFTLQSNQQNGLAVYLRNWHGITMTGNDMQGLDCRFRDCSDITFSDNGTSTYST